MKLVFAILSFVSITSSFAQASEYDDRARAAQEMRAQAEQARRNEVLTINTEKFRKMLFGFARAHGGLADDGKCKVAQDRCSGNYCFPGDDVEATATQLEGQALFVRSCEFTLNDGLACWAYRRYAIDKGDFEGLEASCYDSANRERKFRVPRGGGAAKKKKK